MTARQQALAAALVMAYSFLLTLVIALVVRATVGLRASEEEEVTGLDTTVHAESAYEFGGLGGGGSALSPAPAQSKVFS